MAGVCDRVRFRQRGARLLCQLEDEGFEVAVAEPNILRIRPVIGVTPELRADLQRHKLDLVMLIRICDPAVQDRREVFCRQLETAPLGVLVPRLTFREIPYVSGRCDSCGDVLDRRAGAVAGDARWLGGSRVGCPFPQTWPPRLTRRRCARDLLDGLRRVAPSRLARPFRARRHRRRSAVGRSRDRGGAVDARRQLNAKLDTVIKG